MDRLVRFWDGHMFRAGLHTDAGNGPVWDRIVYVTANGLTVYRTRSDEVWEQLTPENWLEPAQRAKMIGSFKRIARELGCTMAAAELMGLSTFKPFRQSSEEIDNVQL